MTKGDHVNDTEATWPSAEEIVGRHFPLGGPYNGERTIGAAAVAGESVRYLNHATMSRNALPYPVVMADVLGILDGTVAALPQLFRQLAAGYAAACADPGAYVDGMGEVRTVPEAVAEVQEALSSATALAQQLQARVSRARNAAARVGVQASDDDDQ